MPGRRDARGIDAAGQRRARVGAGGSEPVERGEHHLPRVPVDPRRQQANLEEQPPLEVIERRDDDSVRRDAAEEARVGLPKSSRAMAEGEDGEGTRAAHGQVAVGVDGNDDVEIGRQQALDRFGQHREGRVARLLDADLAARIDRIPDLDIPIADIECGHADDVGSALRELRQRRFVGRGGRRGRGCCAGHHGGRRGLRRGRERGRSRRAGNERRRGAGGRGDGGRRRRSRRRRSLIVIVATTADEDERRGQRQDRPASTEATPEPSPSRCHSGAPYWVESTTRLILTSEMLSASALFLEGAAPSAPCLR